MSGLSVSVCNSDADCSGEGKCVQDDQDASILYCDCTLGYIEPHCKNRDPCLLEGNVACQNGSTCRRISNFEYECKCRVPYTGEFCETYDLCDIDVEGCVGDLNKEDPSEPICYPCVVGATCKQVSKSSYTCTCEAGFNDSSCFVAFPASQLQTSRSARIAYIQSENGSQGQPIIPAIAITSCCLYILVIVIVVIILQKRKKCHPKLIVDCDICEFDQMSYYLINVRTGWQWNAGTKGNVYCFLCGKNGEAGPFPLSDLNLCEVDVLKRCQEDNYLVSHAVDLGCLEKLVIWYHNQPQKSTWFCDKITVRNIKTEENWHFFISSWFDSEEPKRLHEFLVATTEDIEEQSKISINLRHFSDQLIQHHTYISPFIYATPDRITLMFSEWMSYMLILIALNEFPNDSNAYTENVNYLFSSTTPVNGSVAAISCFCIGVVCTILLMIFAKQTLIPTLVVWRNKPDIPQYENTNEDEPLKAPNTDCILPVDIPQIKVQDEATNTNYIEEMIELIMPTRTVYETGEQHTSLEVLNMNESDISQVFRIPSTDVLKTEKWVDDSIIDDYHKMEKWLDESVEGNSHSQDIENLNDHQPLDAGVNEPSTGNLILDLAGGDFARNQDQVSETLQSEKLEKEQLYCELCEMEFLNRWSGVSRICVIIGWIICLLLIVLATIICNTHGKRYGYQQSYDWIGSLAICWVENFLVYQSIKVLLVVIIYAVLIQAKKLKNMEDDTMEERFQVYHVNGLTVLPKQEALRFVQYPPKYWIPAPYVKLNNRSNTESVTAII